MVLGEFYTIKEGIYYKITIGETEIFLQSANNDFYYTIKRSAKIVKESGLRRMDHPPHNTDLVWNRLIASHNNLKVKLLPVMPDRSIVIRPDKTIIIPQGFSTQFHIPIPVWLRLSIMRESEIVVCETPSQQLSDTWFGDPISGDLCYNYNSMLYRYIDNISLKAHHAICPVEIQNSSKADLNFQRFCLHVKHLAIFSSNDTLWTNPVTVNFRGKDQVSQVSITPKPPHSGDMEDIQISESRAKPDENVLKRSFQFLKDLTKF